MKRKFPQQTILDPDEVYRIQRLQIAEFYGIPPAQVDAMPASDVDDTLAYLWAMNQK